MPASNWLTKFPRNLKPAYNDLLEHFSDVVRECFLAFNAQVQSLYGVHSKWLRFDISRGWNYGYCRNYRCELFGMWIGEDCFIILGVEIRDAASMQAALERVRERYDKDFEQRYEALVAAKKANQIARTKVRAERERAEMAQIMEGLDETKFNIFKWPPKVSRSKLVRLYNTEAAGLLDEGLLEDIGLAFYLRCVQARQVRALMDKGQILCHHCGEILTPGSYTAPVICACAYSYTYREYRRSCNAANMPGGRAQPVFDEYVLKWDVCKSSAEKMMLIDWMVHECHVTVMSGVAGRSVCANLIEGTLGQIRQVLEMLAGHIEENSIAYI